MARAGQAVPHAPQCETLVRVSASQPLAALLSQSPKPIAQAATAHWPIVQAAVALARSHRRLHAPQWVALARVSTSQPSLGSPLQSAKPAVQVCSQRPAAQLAVLLGRAVHAVPQVPQCCRLVRVSVSQPLAAMRSQSA